MTDVADLADLRLTEWTACGGCAAKWGAAPLSQLVRDLATPTEPDYLALIEGSEHRGGEAAFVAFEGRSDTV